MAHITSEATRIHEGSSMQEIGPIDPTVMKWLQALLNAAEWTHYDKGRDYWTWYPKVRVPGIDNRPESSFFLMIKPAGYVHRHKDNAKDYATHHFVVQSNPYSHFYQYINNKEIKHVLKTGYEYTLDRTVEHMSMNLGATPRIHFLAAL